ncbi:MAG: molecular chaperone TorD family protein [Planctomycetota bacterium]
MTSRARIYGALARALAPPGGDASAFPHLGLPEPDGSDLEAEHVMLFGRAGRAVLSPYEGVHRGTGLRGVLAAYAAAGYAPDPSFHDRPDHVCAELALLEGLAQREEEARDRGERETALAAAERAQGFFLRHIRPWVPAFFDSMVRTEGFALHRALAARAALFLRRESACPGAPRGEVRPEALPAAPLCTTCGRPLGILPPKRHDLHAPWGFVCARCRLRADLRRLES